MSCFVRAEQEKEAAIAEAYHCMSEAKQFQGEKHTIEAAYLAAASKMMACARGGESLQSTATLWYHAATCFEGARKIPLASKSYRAGRFYDRAALVSFNFQDIDDCLLTLIPHSGQMDATLADRIIQACRVHYLRACNYRCVSALTLHSVGCLLFTTDSQLKKLFRGDHNACVEYARSLGFSAQLKDLLKMGQRLEDLANVHLDEGSPVEAVQCLLQIPQASPLERIQEIILSYLWSNFGLDATPAKDSSVQASQLIKICSSLINPSDLSINQDVSKVKYYVILQLTGRPLDHVVCCAPRTTHALIKPA